MKYHAYFGSLEHISHTSSRRISAILLNCLTKRHSNLSDGEPFITEIVSVLQFFNVH